MVIQNRLDPMAANHKNISKQIEKRQNQHDKQKVSTGDIFTMKSRRAA